jgi:hypothetical protein
MPSTLAQFTLGTTAASDDFIVGYDTAVLGGERRWSVSTMANAISGVMNSQLVTLIDSRSSFVVPTGVVSYFASTTAPFGWIECNGATITTALGPSYTALRNLLIATGYVFNTGLSPYQDPQVPNIRGIFIRGVGSQAIGTLTYSGTIGVRQNDALKSHSHVTRIGGVTSGNSGWTGVVVGGGILNGGAGNKDYSSGDASTGASTETRPANISLLACIKL